jgi:hypothetical protein
MVFSAKRTDQIMALYIYIRWKIYLRVESEYITKQTVRYRSNLEIESNSGSTRAT